MEVAPNSIAEHAIGLVRQNPIFWPITWYAAGLGLLTLLWRRCDHPADVLALVAVASSFGLLLSYAAIGVASDLRYHYWTMVAVGLSIVLRSFSHGNALTLAKRLSWFVLPVVACGLLFRGLGIAVFVT